MLYDNFSKFFFVSSKSEEGFKTSENVRGLKKYQSAFDHILPISLRLNSSEDISEVMEAKSGSSENVDADPINEKSATEEKKANSVVIKTIYKSDETTVEAINNSTERVGVINQLIDGSSNENVSFNETEEPSDANNELDINNQGSKGNKFVK